MAIKVFLDANVLLDISLKRKGFENVEKIFAQINLGVFEAFISSSIIHIVFYILSKEYSNKIAKGFILKVLEDIEIIDLNKEISINALLSKIEDVEDALQYYVALHHKMDYFISNDQQLKKESINTLPVYSTSEFVKLFELN